MLAESSNRRLLALARLVVDKGDSLAWWTLLDLTPQIGPAVRNHFYDRAVDSQQTFAKQLLEDRAANYPNLSPGQRTRVESVVGPALELIGGVQYPGADLGEAGWGTWLVAQASELGGCKEDFCDLLKDLDHLINLEEGLGRFLSQVQPVGKDLRSGRAAGSVRLMTMASSKGLTVRAAIVVGVEEGVIPLAGRDPGEERRLLYVAMTRAIDFLYLTWSGQRIGPTARTGAPHVGHGRNRSPLLTHGPVASEDGSGYPDEVITA